MRIVLITITSVAISLFPHLTLAQDVNVGRDIIVSATNTFTALTSDDQLGSGSYTFKNNGLPNGSLDLYKVLIEAPLESKTNFTPLIGISPAYLDFTQNFDRSGSIRYEAEAWGLGATAGLLMHFFEQRLKVIPRFKFEYAEVDNTFRQDSLQLTPELQEILNSTVDTYTYIPSIEIEYAQSIGETESRVFFNSQASYLYLDGSPDSELVSDFSDHSWVLKQRIAAESPLDILPAGEFVARPSVARIDIRDAARNSLDFNNFYEIGIDIVSLSPNLPLLSELGFGATYIYEKEIQGWRFGLNGSL